MIGARTHRRETTPSHARADHPHVDEGQKLLAERQEVAEVARYLEVTPAAWYRWVNQYGGTKAEDAKRLKEPKRENQRQFSSVLEAKVLVEDWRTEYNY